MHVSAYTDTIEHAYMYVYAMKKITVAGARASPLIVQM